MAKSKAAAPSSAPWMKSDADYRSESDHRTLTDAAEIQSDPSRMKGVAKHHKQVKKKVALVQRSLMGNR
jgi:hypothetical protein